MARTDQLICDEPDGVFDDRDDDEYDWEEECDDEIVGCDTCGGQGFCEYFDCYELIEMEGMPLQQNHLVTCPSCNGTGVA